MTQPKDDGVTGERPVTTEREHSVSPRREVLKRLGRFVAVSAPAVTLLLAAQSKPAKALPASTVSSRQFKAGEGAVDTAAMLAAVTSLGGSVETIDPIDGVGMCFAAIKGLAERIKGLELQAVVH